MQRTLLLALFCVITISSQAQKINGKITDVKGESLPYSDIIVKDSLDNMVAYAIANAKGEYTTSFDTQCKTVWVEASFMGYDKQSKKIVLQADQTLHFKLKERTEEIKTVNIVAEAPVQIERNDTVVFNLEKLTDGTEEVVEDILKKLSGVEVDQSGQMKYRGQVVTKMLLDGDDLFQGNYGVGSKNIQAKHIKGVEAVQNYSDNPLLRGMENTDDVAINLKFEKGMSLSHSASLSYGHEDMYSIDYKNIAVSKKLKAFSFLNYNNLGINQPQYNGNPAMSLHYDKGSEFENPGYLETGAKSSLFQSRQSNFNDALSASVNLLPKITESFTVRLNLDFIKDNAENSYSSVAVIQAENPIVIEENRASKLKPQYLKGDLNLTKYLSEDVSFESISRFSFMKNTNEYTGTSNGIEQAYRSHSKADFLYNESNLTWRLNHKNGLKLNAIVSMSESPEDLYVNPGIDLSANAAISVNQERITNDKYQVQFKTDYYHKTKKKDRLNLGVKFNYLSRDLYSDLSDGSLTLVNDIEFRKADYEFTSSYRWKCNSVTITPRVRYNYLDYSHSKEDGEQSLYNGDLRVQYKPSNKHDLIVDVESKQEGIDDNKVFTNYILSSNRSMTRYQLNYGVLKKQGVNLRYTFFNAIKYNQFFLVLSASKCNRAYLSNYEINQDVSYTTVYLGDNDSKNASASVRYFQPVKWLYGKIGLNGSYSYMEYGSELNGKMRNNYIHSQNAGLSWESLAIWYFVMTNRLSYTHSDYGSYGNESISDKFELIFHKNNFRFASQLNYSRPSLDSSIDEFTLNAKVQYKFGKFLLSCEGVNLLNEKGANTINQNDYMSMQHFAIKQKRFVLFGVTFKF